MTKNSYFFAFYGHFHELLPHSIRVPGRFTSLRVMTKKSSFSCFVDVFVTYCPQFWGSIAINTFETYEQNVVIFTFYGLFHELLSFYFGIPGRFTCFRFRTKNSSFFAFYGHFHELLPTV